MPTQYCSVEQLSKLFGVDYFTMLGIVHADTSAHPHIKRLNRYNLGFLISLHRLTNDPLEKSINMDTQFLNLYEVQDILKETGVSMVYSTVLRKAMKGEIPALKFGDTYRVPTNLLLRYITERKIQYKARRKLEG